MTQEQHGMHKGRDNLPPSGDPHFAGPAYVTNTCIMRQGIGLSKKFSANGERKLLVV
jgi:hypothetical protein